ncbi:MAG: hypothetical protein HY557_08500 [Euryarchaeota archaeon]|nr:hypothetical protein [Euryarchaeota archaeon]
MAERHRRPEEPERCSVSGCKDEAERSVSSKRYQAALPGVALNGEVGRRVALCRRHYKEFRKKTKEDRELERLGW